MQSIRQLDSLFPILFGGGDKRNDEEEADDSLDAVFQKHYGWVYSAVLVAEHERITLDQAYDLPVLHFINDLAYLKMKSKVEAKQLESLKRNIK